MILVRDTFHLKFGQMEKVLPRMIAAMTAAPGAMGSRILTDISGRYFTLVVETKAENVEAYRQRLQAGFASQDPEQSAAFAEAVEYGHREIFNIEYEA